MNHCASNIHIPAFQVKLVDLKTLLFNFLAIQEYFIREFLLALVNDRVRKSFYFPLIHPYFIAKILQMYIIPENYYRYPS